MIVFFITIFFLIIRTTVGYSIFNLDLVFINYNTYKDFSTLVYKYFLYFDHLIVYYVYL